jgi:hypothetical protein
MTLIGKLSVVRVLPLGFKFWQFRRFGNFGNFFFMNQGQAIAWCISAISGSEGISPIAI